MSRRTLNTRPVSLYPQGSRPDMHAKCGQQEKDVASRLFYAAFGGVDETPARARCGQCRAFTLARRLRDQEIAGSPPHPFALPPSRLLPSRFRSVFASAPCVIAPPLACAAASSSLLITPLSVGLSFRHGTGRNSHDFGYGG